MFFIYFMCGLFCGILLYRMLNQKPLFLRPRKRLVKFLIQRLYRGWDDSDTWNLDYTLAEFLLPRFKRYRKLTNCYPDGLSNDEWINILDDIEFFLTEKSKNVDFITENSSMKDKYNRGKQYFGQYIEHLWW